MVEKVVNLKVTDNVDQTAKSIRSLRAQLKDAVSEVAVLSAKFGATSEQAVNAAKRAAELKDAIGDAKNLTDAFNPDAKFKALTSTLGGVAGGFSAVQGAVGLLGSESQSVEKAILKVQSAMAISQGVQAIGESVDSFKQLGAVIRATTLYQKALAGATAVQTFVMNGATLAAKALRGALIATGVGALVVGVGLLIANFDKVKKVVMNLIPGLSAVGDIVMSIVNTVTDFIGVTSEAERANERLKASAAASIALNKKYLAEHGSQLDEFTKQKLAAKDKYNEAIQEENADRIALAKELNRELAAIDKARQDEKDKKAKEAQDKLNEAETKRKEKEKEAAQKAKEARDKELAETNDFLYKISEAGIEQRILEKEQSDEKITEIENEFAKIEQAEIVSAEKRAEDLIKFEENKNKVLASSKENLNNIIAGLENTGIAKTKAGQTVSKAIALTQIGIDSAVAISKASTLANAEGVAAQLAFPLIPGAGTAARVISYASTALSVASNITRAKQLLSSGGSGGGGSSSSSGSAPTPPQFNIVGQSGTNQLAQTIAGQQNKPIEAFVVSSAVSTSQALDRNRVKTATFGG